MQTSRQKSGTRTETAHLVYIVECEDGLFRLVTFSDTEIAEGGGIAAAEATLCSEYKWSERLGYVPVRPRSGGGISFREIDLERLVWRCTRRMARTTNVCELEYMSLDGPDGARN